MIKNVKEHIRHILLHTQTYTGTDNVYIAKTGFWTTFAYGANTVLSFVTVWAFANFIPKETYGTYKYVLALIGSLGLLMLSGINTAVAQAVSRGQDRAVEYAVWVQLKWNLLFMAVGLGMSGYYALKGNTLFAATLGILSITTPIISALNTYGPYLTGKKEFKKAALYSLVSGIFYSLVLTLAVISSDNIIILVGANALGTLVPVAFFYLLIERTIQGPELSEEEKQALLRYTGHLSLVNIVAIAGQYIDKIMTFQYVGPVALAVYSFATVGPDRVKGWLKSIGGAIFPKLTARSLHEIDRVFYTRTLQAMGIGLIAAALYSAAVPFVFQLLFPKYMDSVLYSQVLSLSLVGVTAGIYMGQVFTAQKIIPIIYFGSLTVHGGKILLFVVLGYFWGAWGVITAAIGIQFFSVAWHSWLWYWYVRRNLRLTNVTAA